MRTISASRARRLALTAQGLARTRPPAGVRRDVRHLRRVLDTVDVVQLDSVNVLARAHELPFFSRLGAHDRAGRDAWLWGSRDAYEGWIHDASCTSVEVWPLLAHRRAAQRSGPRRDRLEREHPGELARVLAEVTQRGPTTVGDLDDPGARTGPWWGNPRGKVALDELARGGELTITGRTPEFVTIYDRTERVIPARLRKAEIPPLTDANRALIRRAARTHGIATAAELADHHRLPIGSGRRAVADLVAAGELEEVRVAGAGEVAFYLDPSARAARVIPTRTLLSPFDPVVWHRDRIERLFAFRYRIEIYTPAAKRVHGYYVLPFLLGGRLVARVDLKADRTGLRLLVRGAFAEAGADGVAVARELAAELGELAAWLGLGEVEVADHGGLAPALTGALP